MQVLWLLSDLDDARGIEIGELTQLRHAARHCGLLVLNANHWAVKLHRYGLLGVRSICEILGDSLGRARKVAHKRLGDRLSCLRKVQSLSLLRLEVRLYTLAGYTCHVGLALDHVHALLQIADAVDDLGVRLSEVGVHGLSD